MQNFEVHPALAKKIFVCDLPLCRILLENNKIFPWIFLVPRVSKVSQINHLSFADQLKLIGELNFASNVMEELFPCDRLNVAAIGNKTDQLHIHVICRFTDDPYWPDTVWQYLGEKMDDHEANERLRDLCKAFEGYSPGF
ncbi:MAG: HIT domain-containing protein [Puniceicoccales bacterium]|nr:HIT domain-containing protein [Puniceicoccales bacterium]